SPQSGDPSSPGCVGGFCGNNLGGPGSSTGGGKKKQ
ncbi:hypothetical protein PgNI_10895, partial [Pyricularia grisea]|uniref:Uncharacterized protein n=1 Tax=Pyricularia grisea TaxID=148305 RepID=A0A6P8B0A3_PYRGI